MSNPVDRFHETNDRFSWHWVGTEIHQDENRRAEQKGDYWDVVVNVTESAGLFNDSLSVNGIATHKAGPHGEGVNPNSFPVRLRRQRGELHARPERVRERR